ncbi:MAG TPA: GDSL-type esterase/lipase family protein [Chthoniobacterales bacterium]|jgi:lysophospholipase L1-like esterase
MLARSGKKRIVAVLALCLAGVFLLGGVLAVSHCGEKIVAHFKRKFQMKARTSRDAMTPEAKDVERHDQFIQRAKQGDIDLLFLGDSITEWWPRLGESSWMQLAPYKPANFGIAGDCTEHVLWRIEHGELDGISPKVVTLLIGTNNVGLFADEKPEWVAHGIEKIVSVIRERSPRSKVLLLGIFPRGDKDSRERRAVAEINRMLAPLDDGAKVRFADFGAQFLDGSGNISADIMPDQLHLSAKGYAIWYRELAPILREMMQ